MSLFPQLDHYLEKSGVKSHFALSVWPRLLGGIFFAMTSSTQRRDNPEERNSALSTYSAVFEETVSFLS
jgi:hypothetical protein